MLIVILKVMNITIIINNSFGESCSWWREGLMSSNKETLTEAWK